MMLRRCEPTERAAGSVARVVPLANRKSVLSIEARIDTAGGVELVNGLVETGFCVAGTVLHFFMRVSARIDTKTSTRSLRSTSACTTAKNGLVFKLFVPIQNAAGWLPKR